MSLLLAWLQPHVARKHRLVQAPGPVVFLIFLVLAQGGGGKGKRGSFMFVIVHSPHNNIVPHIAAPWGNVSAPGIFCDPCPTGGLLPLICWATLYGFCPLAPGTSADVLIWDGYGLSRTRGDFFDFEVGGHDVAYKGRIHVIVPVIGRKNGTLTARQQCYNDVHGWYRAHIEQLFARLWHAR